MQPVDRHDGDQDALIITAMAAGDQRAVGLLYDRYSTLLWSIAKSVVGDDATAEEVVQETFLAVWQRASTYDADRASVATWLSMITRARAIDVIRSRSARPAQVSDEQSGLLERADDRADTVASVLEHVVGERVRDAVRTLPVELRQLVALAYFGGYSHSEIASRLTLPLGTVKTRLHTALTRLRLQLDDVESRNAT